MAARKRGLQVNVHLSDSDMALFHKAKQKLYGDVHITNSSLLLALAKQRAEQVLAPGEETPKKHR